MSFQRYSKYKESGVEWLGEVPEHWHLKRLKHIFKEREERSVNGDEMLLSVSAYSGVSPRSEIIDDGDHLSRADSLIGYKICHENDLVVNIMLAWNRGLAFSGYHGIVSPAYCVYFVINESSPKFLNYLVRSNEYTRYFKAFSSGVIDSRLRIYPETFGRLFCGLPPLKEQTAIAAFLDRETAKIDALVAEQQRLMELLKEKRQAVISHAVTRGLNPAAPLKNSGIEWLGQVPEHWELLQVKRLASFVTSGPRGWSERVGDVGSLFIQSGDINDLLEIEFEKAKRVSITDDAESVRTQLKEGDVVICITGAKTGNVAVAAQLHEDAYINQHLCLIRPTNEVLSMFLGTTLKSRIGQTYFDLSQYGLKQGLSLENIKEAPVILPPLKEQEDIIAHLDVELSKFDTLIAEAQRAIDLLQERRTALISAAVTGQIDVRKSAATPLTLVKPYSSGFARQLLAAEILDHCHQHPTMGRVKLQKLIHLCEHVAELEEVGAHYARKAAGPFDNKVMFGIASGLSKQKWFAEVKDGTRTVYQPLEHAGEHRKYLARWEDKMPQINKVLHLLGKADTQQCEIVSTLYAAWNDLLIEGQSPTDEAIIHEASSPDRWHENKAKISPEKWPKALAWMREKDLVPKGFGNHTSRPI